MLCKRGEVEMSVQIVAANVQTPASTGPTNPRSPMPATAQKAPVPQQLGGDFSTLRNGAGTSSLTVHDRIDSPRLKRHPLCQNKRKDCFTGKTTTL
jgi:hypothetical protein